MKRVKENRLKGTKKEKEIYDRFIRTIVCYGKAEVTCQVEHLAAEDGIRKGQLIATKKKNYGKIAEVELRK